MLEKLKMDLQLFGEGGEGGDGGAAAPAGESVGTGKKTGEDVPAFIPERAKEMYRKAQKRMASNAAATSQTQNAQNETDESDTPAREEKQEQKKEHVPFADLIKSDEYRDEHQKYMEKTISDRLKKYKGMETDLDKAHSALDIVAEKYGIDMTAEGAMDQLTKAIQGDDSYYEKYALDHDVSPEEARRIVTLERQVRESEAQRAALEQEESNRQRIAVLYQNAEKTRTQFPDFVLENELQDERFRKLVAVNNGDTTAAYVACHWNDLMQNAARNASQQAAAQTAQAVASGRNRPVEASGGATPSSVPEPDFRSMGLKEIRAYAEEQRRRARR